MEKRVIFSYTLVVAGLFAPFWPLALFGIAMLIFFGEWFGALVCALLLDVAYGPATGTMHLFVLPVTFFTAIFVLLRAYVTPYLRPKALHSI